MAGQADELAGVSYNAGFIVLSYLVSLAGCATCVELLHRRTARFGLYNWYLLVTAAICMGGIGIWCMHFIGNRATILHSHGQIASITYSPRFTALSFFLPIVVLTIAFYFVGTSERADVLYIAGTGALTGAAVCGMHYVGQLGIANFRCSYQVGNVVGAAIIAVAASITALGVFFRLRAAWTDNWWKRLICSSILAVAVSGMHWTAAVGTNYHVRDMDKLGMSGGLSATETVIVCATLSCAACVCLIVLTVITNRRHRQSAHRVRQLVLACAYFDPSGRLMVAPGGFLPTRKITNQYIERTFADDEFSRTHPAFIWALRASHNWPSLRKLIPGMRHHLVSDEVTKQYFPGTNSNSHRASGAAPDLDFEFIFKELFSVAAHELANQVHQPVEKIGVLYDDVVITGTQTAKSLAEKARIAHGAEGDPENMVPHIFGKGQFLFTVRQLDKEEAANLAAGGYRFATAQQIAPTLSRNMQVSQGEIQNTLNKMWEFSSEEKMMDPGVHLVCFSLHPSVRKGFDVLACKDAPNLLPSVPFKQGTLSPSQMDILARMEDWSVDACLRWLRGDGGFADSDSKNFCRQLHVALTSLVKLIESPAFGQAKFSARRIMIPCKGLGPQRTPAKCTAYSFRIIYGLQSRVASPRLCLTPLRLFSARQQIYPGIPDHEDFRQTLLEEFAHCAKAPKTSKSNSSTSSYMGGPPSSYTPNFSRLGIKSGKVSKYLPNSEDDEAPIARAPSFGGIMVSNQVTVDVVECERPPSILGAGVFEMTDMGVTTEAVYAGPLYETFVDELCAICREAPEPSLESRGSY